MTANVVGRAWEWRTFVWAGVLGSVVAWAWVWLVTGGASVVMLFAALASVVLALRATKGMRLALVGLMVAGLAMFLASLYWLTLVLFVGGNQVTAVDALTTSVFPMVAAIVLLLGSAAGFRHAGPATNRGATTAS